MVLTLTRELDSRSLELLAEGASLSLLLAAGLREVAAEPSRLTTLESGRVTTLESAAGALWSTLEVSETPEQPGETRLELELTLWSAGELLGTSRALCWSTEADDSSSRLHRAVSSRALELVTRALLQREHLWT